MVIQWYLYIYIYIYIYHKLIIILNITYNEALLYRCRIVE
jgi:hypothetical protein